MQFRRMASGSKWFVFPRFLTLRPSRLNHAGVTRFFCARFWALGMLLAVSGCVPRGPEALRRGDEALAGGRPGDAVPLLERAVTDMPSSAVAWNQLGLAYQAIGKPEEARKAYLRALGFDRNLFDIQFNLGALECEAGRWTEAEKSLRTYLGVERNRTNVQAWRLLGEAQLATQQSEAAERTLTVAAQLSPNDPTLRNRLGWALGQRRRWKEAQAQFAQAVRQDPAFADARLNLAVATQQLGDRRGALEHYRAYLSLNPGGGAPEAVRRQAELLESQLAPPPAVSTNLTTVKPVAPTNSIRTLAPTNAVVSVPTPTRASTSGPGVAPKTSTNPATPNPTVATWVAAPPAANPLQTNAATASPPPAPVTPAPSSPTVEVVRVEEAPPLRVARDPVKPPVSAPAPVSNTAPAIPAPGTTGPTHSPRTAPVSSEAATTAPTTTSTASTAPTSSGMESAGAETESRKTFWKRVNPVSWGNPMKWFRDNPTATNRPPAPKEIAKAKPKAAPTNAAPSTLPLPSATPPTANPPAVSTAAPRRPPPAAPAKPVVPRYPQGNVSTLTPGNRAAAEAAAAQSSADRVETLERAVQLDPSWSAGWMQLGRAAIEAGRPRVALTAGEAAVTLEPKSAAAQQLFAAALSRSGYSADAADHLEQAVEIAPGNAAVHLALAGIYARELGETARARVHYEQVLSIDPQHPQAAAIRSWLSSNP